MPVQQSLKILNMPPEGEGFSGHIEEKRGWLYCVLNVIVEGKDGNPVRKPKYIPTKLRAKGNKTKAKKMLAQISREWAEQMRSLQQGTENERIQSDQSVIHTADPETILFVDFLPLFLKYKRDQATKKALGRKSIELTTYSGYATNIKNPIAPYFKEHPVTVQGFKKKDAVDFYTSQFQLEKKATTIRHYHAVIHQALEYAVELGLINFNPTDKIQFPDPAPFQGDYYAIEEVWDLFRIVVGTKFEIPTILAAFYGLRREEVIGLQWSAFNFHNDVFTIRHTVTSCNIDGKYITLAKDTTKSQSSTRSLPLVPFIKSWLLGHKKQQEMNRVLCGNSYCQDYLNYVCVDSLGNLIKPGYISGSFKEFLRRHHMREIRFHDLRHTCAALLSYNGVGIEDIMKWLGHSDIKITARYYMHLQYISKVAAAKKLSAAYRPKSSDVFEEDAQMEEQIAALKRQVSELEAQVDAMRLIEPVVKDDYPLFISDILPSMIKEKESHQPIA